MKFKVTVTLTAKKTYTYEIDAASTRKAEDAALDKAVGEFCATHHDADDDTEIETEQFTQDCEECGVEFALGSDQQWTEDGDVCAECGAKIEAEEKAGAAQ